MVKNKSILKKIGKYLKEISVVIIGIVITFTGSDLISKRARQKEVRNVMELIKEELQGNIEHLEEVLEKLESERMLYVDLIENRHDLRSMSLDSLQRRRGFITYVSSFVPKKDAFDLLKSSSLMQYIKNKDLMLKVIEAYDKLYMVEMDIKSYYEYKSRAMTETIEGLPLERYEDIWSGGDGYKYYEIFLTHVKSLSFIGTARDFFEEPLENTVTDLCEVIGLMSKEYGLK